MARQQKNKIIHLFETFSIQVLTFLNSERVNRILSGKNSLFERPGFNLPREPKKMLIFFAPEIKSGTSKPVFKEI